MQLKSYLDRQKISRAAFGASIGVSEVAVTRYINGDRIPRAAKMALIEAVTEGAVKPNDFFAPVAKPSEGRAA